MEKLNLLEEERLNNQMLETRGYVERELEALKLAKDSFAANMEHEKSASAEKYQNEKSKMFHDFEVQKQELETKLQNREAEIENQLRERENSFEEERDREQTNIKRLREVASRDMEEMKLERLNLEKEKQEIFTNQEHLEAQQLEMRKDIDDLVGLSMKLKDQREQFFKERERFVAFVENQKGCKDCGQRISEFMFSDLQSLEVNNAETFTLPRIADDCLKEAVQGTSERPNGKTPLGAANSGSPASGITMSWLGKCSSKVFIFSAGKKHELEGAQNGKGSAQAQEKLLDVGEIPEYILSSEDEPEGSARVAIDSVDVQRTQSEYSTREVEAGLDPSVNDLSNINNQAHDIEEISEQPNMNEGQSKPTRRGRTRASKTRSKKAIVGDPTAARENNGSVCANGASKHTVYTNEERPGESDLVGKGTSKIGRKRNCKHTSEQDPEYSECTDITTGGRRNRRRKAAPVVEAPQQKRYNLRRPRIAAPMASGGALSNPSKKEGVDGVSSKDGVNGVGKDKGPGSNAPPGPSTSFANGNHGGDSQADEFRKSKVAEDMVSSKEFNGTPQQDSECGNGDYEIETPAAQDEEVVEDSEGEDGDEVEHPGEVSIGRKLWSFIST